MTFQQCFESGYHEQYFSSDINIGYSAEREPSFIPTRKKINDATVQILSDDAAKVSTFTITFSPINMASLWL
ncbi:Calcium-transporting ATPase 2 [Venturia inaequalis]|nr:Calcium-transporting ATPase 2 [Venturia inaequalis]